MAPSRPPKGSMMAHRTACVIGAGSWGTALAIVLARGGLDVRLVARNTATARAIDEQRENARYLPGIPLPERIRVTADRQAALQHAAVCVLALPCQAAEHALPLLGDAAYPVVAAFKGLDPERLERTDQMLLRHLPPARVALLSGPSFAVEVARGQPTAITMAARTIPDAERAASFFEDTSFRIYTSDDMVGVALGGALKNVIAIAAGIADGLALGHNAIAAAVTRGLAEIARIAEASGGRSETLMGLAGLGDLVLSCTGSLSRNRRFGIALAQGMAPEAAQAHIGQVVEGVRTARAASRLASGLGIDAPLIRTVDHVIRGELNLREAVESLLNRPERREF
ncbi:MAG: NAD(P)H-dependent glycerol-3-phosphate dehydrogenase [Mariprofundaceae bacterium]